MKRYLLFVVLCGALILSLICTGCKNHVPAGFKLTPITPPTIGAKVIHRVTQTPAALQSTATFLDIIMPLGVLMLIVGVSLLIFLPAAYRLELAIAGTGGSAFGVAALLRISLWAFPVAAWTMAAVVAAGAVLFIYKWAMKVKAGDSPLQAAKDEIGDLTRSTPPPLVKA